MENKESKRGQKLYYYLSRLTIRERKDFHAYLSSPLLGNSLQMARMLLVIEAEVLEKDGKVIDADLFQAEFFPNQDLDEGKRKYIRIRLVQMLDRLLDFAAFMEYKGDTNAQHVSLLKAMFTRGWEKYFERTYQEIEAMPPKKDFGEYHLYRMRREIVRNDYLTRKLDDTSISNINETTHKIDAYIIFIALKYGCARLNTQITGQDLDDTKFEEQSLAHAFTSPYYDILEIKAYAHSYELLQRQKRGEYGACEHYTVLKNILSNPSKLDSSEGIDLFGLAYNYCKWSINKGAFDFIQELRILIDDALAKGTILPAGKIPQALFQSIVNQMCRFGEVHWSAEFAEKWKGNIAGDDDLSVYYVVRCFVHYLFGEHDKVIELLYNRLGSINDTTLNLSARIYLCRSAWEKGDFSWLSSQLEALRVYLIRLKTRDKARKSLHLGFVDYFNKMCMAKLGNPDLTKPKLEALKERIEINQETQKYFWLYKTLNSTLEKLEKGNN